MIVRTSSPLSSAPGSPVRTAAVLHLESPSASGAQAEDNQKSKAELPELPDIDLSPYNKMYGLHNMPTLDGSQLQDSLDKDEGTRSNIAVDETPSKVDLLSIFPKSRRLDALLHALSKLYLKEPVNPPTNPSTSSGAVTYSAQSTDVYSLGPEGPPAAISFELSPRTSRQTFPPTWLASLAPSLLVLALSGSKCVNPSAWQLPVLSSISRLVFIRLREAVLTSPLPTDLSERLPSLRILDLNGAHFKLPEADVVSMLVALCGGDPSCTNESLGAGTAGLQPAHKSQVLTTMGDSEDVWPPRKAPTRYRQQEPEKRDCLNIYIDAMEGEREGDSSPKAVKRSLASAVALRSIRAARERIFLSYARELWWGLEVPDMSLILPVLVDVSMIRLVYDLGLLPLLPPEEEESKERAAEDKDKENFNVAGTLKSARNGGAGKPAGDDGAGKPAADGSDAPKEDMEGHMYLFEKRDGSRGKKVLYLSNVGLLLSWPYDSPRLDKPDWIHQQAGGSPIWGTFKVFLSTRQWSLLMESEQPAPDPLAATSAAGAAAVGGGLLPVRHSQAGGSDLWDPFETEVLTLMALEQRMWLHSSVMQAACDGAPLRMLDPNLSRRGATSAGSYALMASLRPPGTTPVVVPTAAALAARTAARRTLVAGLLGVGTAGVSPAVRGSVSTPMLLTAIRLESRLYGRVRRVSILPPRHSAYAVTHADRYWASVRSLYELMLADQRVRLGLLTGAVPLAAATEIPSAELRLILDKQAKAVRKSEGGTGGVDSGGPAVLLERATLAADAADMDALLKQTLVGGILHQPVPIFVEDWIPAERSLDSLCSWYIPDAPFWPHGTVLHGAVARGATRTVGWLLDQGLSLDAKISLWLMTPLHLCCMRPCLWRTRGAVLQLRRIPRIWAPPRPPQPPPKKDAKKGEFYPFTELHARLDKQLGLPIDGVYLGRTEYAFPKVNRLSAGDIGGAQVHSPPWYSNDDEFQASEKSQPNMLQIPFARSLACTAPMAGAAASGTAPPSQLSTSAAPMLRLLLRRGADCGARSWCGLTPVHYAAATCGPETLAALAEAKADLRAPMPGTLVSSLHIIALRAELRWSGMPPGAAARLLSYRPVASPTDLLALCDEWRCCPLSRLVAAGKNLPAAALGSLLSSVRAELGGRPTTPEMLEGVSRTIACCIINQQVDHVRMLLQHFPEAAAARLPPLGFSPLHVAAYLPAWWDAKGETLIGTTITGNPLDEINSLPKFIQDQCTPYASPEGIRQYADFASAASVATTDTAKPMATAGSGVPVSAVSAANKLELLVLGDTESSPGASVSGRDGGNAKEERWEHWPYPLLTTGPPTNESIGETESTVLQACLASQLQFIQLLLAAGAPVDLPDAAGVTPLMLVAMVGSAPAVGALLAKGASVATVSAPLRLMREQYASRRLSTVRDLLRMRCLGLDYLLVPEEAKKAALEEKRSGDGEKADSARKTDDSSDEEDNEIVYGYNPDEEESANEEEDDEEADARRAPTRKGSDAETKKPKFVTTPGDDLMEKNLTEWKEMFNDFRLTPLTAAILRVMQHASCLRRQPTSNLGRRADGQMADWKLEVNDTKWARFGKVGDGVIWLIMRHATAELREVLLKVMRTTDVSELVTDMPRTSVWVLGDELKGSRYVSYADRAAREACAALSPFTTVSLDAAIQKALNIAIQTARLGYVPTGASRSITSTSGGDGRPRWGPHEDEILADLMHCGLYPLFMSTNMTNGEASILRMSASLLHFATKAKVSRQALVESHAAQFPPAVMQPAYGNGGDLDAADHSMDDTEMLLLGSFETACSRSQQRLTPLLTSGAAATGGTLERSGPSVGGGGKDGGGGLSSVLLMHTQDDLEHGMMYSRVAELFPPVTSMRMAVGHRAVLPDLTLRPLADTMFKFVRVLCHVSQKELDWVRMPGGVCQTAIDGLFGPLIPGDPGWNVTDMFRPRNFGFRLTFAYTRRSLTIELHAMTLMRTVPMDIQDATANGAGTAAALAADAATATVPAGAASGAGTGGKVTATKGTAAAAALRGGAVGADAVKHSRVEEFKQWLRNPDTVRMEQVQSMAGRLEKSASKVHGNWRQMPVPPVWWISGWVDRFLRLFLMAALSSEENMKKTSLYTLYDNTVRDPFNPVVEAEGSEGRPSASSSPSYMPWTPIELHVLSMLLQLQPLQLDDETDEDLKDMAGRKLSKKEIRRVKKILGLDISDHIVSMANENNPDRGCITFTAQWNKLAESQKWPARSTLEVQDIMFRMIRMSSCSYSMSWSHALTSMMAVLMAGDSSPELRRETEAKLLSLAADTSFARRLVWGTCRGRLAEARALALLSGVLEFQPTLLAALLEHEHEGETLPFWHQTEHFWAVASGPALASMQPSYLATSLQLQHRMPQPPLVIPANTASTAAVGDNAKSEATTASDGTSTTSPPTSPPTLMYCRFSSRKQLERAVAKPLVIDDQWVALVPVSQWEATAVPSGAMPQRGAIQVRKVSERERGDGAAQRAVALSFFSLVFSRLPRGLIRSDPHAAGTLWGRGIPAVVMHRRPAGSRWAPWSTPADVAEEAAVVGALFDAHAAEPLPRTWMRELGATELGLVGYRDFLLAYMRHRAGDFLEGKQQSQLQSLSSVPSVASKGEEEGVADPAAVEGEAVGVEGPQKGPMLAASAATGAGAISGARRWQAAVKQVTDNHLAQAFWDRTLAMRRLKDRDSDAAASARQHALWNAERDPKAAGGLGAGGGGPKISAMRNFGARALEALGGGPGGGQTTQLPSVTLAGLDAVAAEEVCAVQRCAWVAYANLRSAARYLNLAQSEGAVTFPTQLSHFPPTANTAGPAPPSKNQGLTAWQAAERTALSSMLRPVSKPEALFTPVNTSEPDAYGGGGGGPRSWLEALGAAPEGPVRNSGGGEDAREDGRSLLADASGPPGACRRDVPLLELLLELSAATGAAAHTDLLTEGEERPVGPMAGPSRLLAARTLAAAATQLGADAAFELASGCGALALSAASGAAGREGLTPPLGGLDEVFCASALKLAAEEVWGFVADMQALVDLVVLPLVAAADQNVPIIQRESIKTIFGDTSIELILEYEMELLKLMTVHWRGGARTAMVAPGVGGPAAYLTAAAQRRVAASRLRGYTGDFAPSAEELGVDPLSVNVQLRPLLIDPRAIGEVLDLLQRLVTAYQHYLDHIDEGLAELLTCLEADEKGTLAALLRRFSRPAAVKYGKPVKGGMAYGLHPASAAAEAEVPAPGGDASAEAGAGDGSGNAQKKDEDDSDRSDEDEKEDETKKKEGDSKGAKDDKTTKRKGKDGGGRGVGVQLEAPPHHVRPLLSVRQMARYGPGAEVEACLRKPAAHLATLAFLATLCRSISAAQGKVPDLTSNTTLNGTPSGGLTAGPTAATAPNSVADSTWGSDGAGGTLRRGRSGRASEGPDGGSSANGGGTAGRSSGLGGFFRRLNQRLSGVRVSRVLPLGNGVHPLLQVFPEALYGGPTPHGGFVTAASMEHRVVLRSVGAAVLSNTGDEGDGVRLGGGVRTAADRLNAWMEKRLLSGGRTSEVLCALLTAAVCCTWRVVPLMSELQRAAEDMRVANNLLKHRHVIRKLERAINVRPEDDEALDAEVREFHAAIAQAVEDAAKEMDLGEGDATKMSPMYLDAGFWDKKAPRRVSDPAHLRAALRAAEAATLHSTFAGARLLSNARRCAARLGASPAAGGKGAGSGKGAGNGAADEKGGKGGKGGSGGAPAYDSDSDEAEKMLDAIATGPQAKKADKGGKVAPAGKEKKRKKDNGNSKGGEVAGEGVGSAAVVVPFPVARLFGGIRKTSGAGATVGLAVAAAPGGAGPKSAWGTSSGGVATAAAAMVRARQFGAALRRAVKRREHARRRWDKTFYLVMQSGALDESLLAREHATTVAALNRESTLRAWRQLRSAGSDILMVFGAVAFRDVGRTFALVMAFFLMAFPFAVLGVALQVNPTSRHELLVMAGLVGAYVCAGFLAMVAAVAQLRRDPSQLKVYRPSDHIRFPNFRKGTALSSWKAHWVNVFALVTLLLEVWQLCAFSYQRQIPYPRESMLKAIFPWALLDLGPAAYFLQVGALSVFMLLWILVFFPQTPAGLKRIIMPFLGQAAYLTITAGLLSQLNCQPSDGKLVRNLKITCWTSPKHLYGAVAAMLALGLYVPRATLTPFEVFFPSENLDIKYRGLYVRVVQLLRLGMAGYNLFFSDTYPLGVMVANAIGCGLLAAMTIIMRPCCIGAVNIGRGTGFVAATWSQIVSAVALYYLRDRTDENGEPLAYMDHSTRQLYTDDWRYVYVLFSGWTVIAAVGLWLLRRHLRLLRSAAIRFSLKTSPFNFTLPRTPPEIQLAAAAAAAGAGRSTAHIVRAPPLPPAPPPTLSPAKVDDVPGGSGSGTGNDDVRPQQRLGSDATIPVPMVASEGGEEASGAEKKGQDSEPDDKSDDKSEGKTKGEEADDEKKKEKDSDDDEEEEDDDEEEEAGSGANNDSGGSGGTKTALSAAHAAAQAAVSGTALGLPVMSRKLYRKLWTLGLMTPLDEMLSYMSALVRGAERRLEGMESDGSNEGAGAHGFDLDDEDEEDEDKEDKDNKEGKDDDEEEDDDGCGH